MNRVPSLHVLEVKYSISSVTIKSWRFDKTELDDLIENSNVYTVYFQEV